MNKRPSVTRFLRKKTYAGRDVKRTRVVRRNTLRERGRKIKPMMKGR